MRKARLIGWKDLAPEVRHFDFETADGSEFSFAPGQFISVKESVANREITRAYSIASPRNGAHFALCLNRVRDGLVSPKLFEMNPGDEMEIHEPLGYFTLRHLDRRAVFVATGTGIAPFRSILLDPVQARDTTLLFGVRYEGYILYGEEFERLAKERDNFKFVSTITRPTDTWTGRVGRVHAHLDEALGQSTASDTDVYICGLKEMVDEVRTELKRRGFDRKQIVYEKYD